MKTSYSSEDVLVRAQDTPNPYALKFVVNFPLKTEGKATFVSVSECGDLPLVSSLFSIPGVVQVYLFENTLTITHSGELDSELVKDHVGSVLRSRVGVHDPDFTSPDEKIAAPIQRDYSDLPEERRMIEEILDRTIRPGLQADGGDLEIVSFEDDELKILYQGACGGCPSAMSGTLEAIQNILRHEMGNDAIKVVPI